MSAEDILAVHDLANRYTDAANRTDIDGMIAVYAPDGELDAFGNVFKGHDALREAFVAGVGSMELMNQVCSSPLIRIDGDRATARWNITEFARKQGSETLDLFIGNYEDEMVRVPGGWLFARRRLTRRTQLRANVTFRK